MPTIIHINDNNLVIQNMDELSRSQGYAWLKDGEVYFDFDHSTSAIANCRLDPQQINSRYWQQCEQSAIGSNNSGMRHAADLIWQHLSQLKKVHSLDKVVLVVPSHYQTANLQLLLGVAKSVGLQVIGLLNKAVYAIHQGVKNQGLYLHIDVQLHQTVCSEVIVSNHKAKLGQIETLHDVNIQSMQDSLLKEIQNRFIANDRFDPLHHAETEQQLFDQLPMLASELVDSGKANISIEYQLHQHVSSVDAKQWNNTLNHYFETLKNIEVNSKPDFRCFDFNGFNCLKKFTKNDFLLKETPSVSNIVDELISNQANDNENLTYHTELQCTDLAVKSLAKNTRTVNKSGTNKQNTIDEPTVDSLQENSGSVNLATHLLHSGIAVPIKHAHVTTSSNQLGLKHNKTPNLHQLIQENKLFVLGDVERKTINVNDRLGSNLADGVITVIHTIDGSR